MRASYAEEADQSVAEEGSSLWLVVMQDLASLLSYLLTLSSDEIKMSRPREKTRNLVAYWLLGLCNNYAYVIMLSAAHDILSEDFQGNVKLIRMNPITI